MLLVTGLVVQLGLALAQLARYDPTCPKNWVQYEDACYRFVRSPIKRRDAAREACQVSFMDVLHGNTVACTGLARQIHECH